MNLKIKTMNEQAAQFLDELESNRDLWLFLLLLKVTYVLCDLVQVTLPLWSCFLLCKLGTIIVSSS